jgi:hypothetical protein
LHQKVGDAVDDITGYLHKSAGPFLRPGCETKCDPIPLGAFYFIPAAKPQPLFVRC